MKLQVRSGSSGGATSHVAPRNWGEFDFFPAKKGKETGRETVGDGGEGEAGESGPAWTLLVADFAQRTCAYVCVARVLVGSVCERRA